MRRRRGSRKRRRTRGRGGGEGGRGGRVEGEEDEEEEENEVGLAEAAERSIMSVRVRNSSCRVRPLRCRKFQPRNFHPSSPLQYEADETELETPDNKVPFHSDCSSQCSVVATSCSELPPLKAVGVASEDSRLQCVLVVCGCCFVILGIFFLLPKTTVSHV